MIAKYSGMPTATLNGRSLPGQVARIGLGLQLVCSDAWRQERRYSSLRRTARSGGGYRRGSPVSPPRRIAIPACSSGNTIADAKESNQHVAGRSSRPPAAGPYRSRNRASRPLNGSTSNGSECGLSVCASDGADGHCAQQQEYRWASQGFVEQAADTKRFSWGRAGRLDCGYVAMR